MIRAKASSTLDANPAAISARAMVGRPIASSSAVGSAATCASIGIPISRSSATVLIEPGPAGPALGRQDRLERLVVGVHPEPEDVQLPLPQTRGRA